MKKTILAISDTHCGHVAGLTHPNWQGRCGDKWDELQAQMWEFYRDAVKSLGKIDVLLFLGDAIDGKGGRSGGTEIFLPDLNDQIMAAADAINFCKAKDVVMVYGTPYHAASMDGMDLEDIIAERTGAHIGSHEWVTVEGVTLDCKHKVGSSSVPYGRATAVNKELLWNTLWAERGANPKADIILRGHVHYHAHTSSWDCGKRRHAMTLPALQGPGSKYGTRQCSGLVDFGITWFKVDSGKILDWDCNMLEIKPIAKGISL